MKSRGHISIVFDDGYSSIFEKVVPLLHELKIPGVFAIPLSTKNLERSLNRSFTPWQQWLDIRNQGHEIAAHSESHTDLTECAPDTLIRELSEPARQLQATTLVYPGGGFSDSVVQEANRYYSAGRTVLHGFESMPPKDPMRLRTYNFTKKNFSTSKANLLALWAVMSDRWLIETYHIVDDNEKEHVHAVSFEAFANHMRFIARLPIHTVTIQQAVQSR